MKALTAPLCLAATILILAGCVTTGELARGLSSVLAADQPLSTETIVAGLKDALEVGTQRATAMASREGAYSDTPWLRIPMPEALDGVASKLRTVGLGSYVDQFERRMNAAAEQAATQAAPVFVDAVRQMSFADARQILAGGDTAATEYFRGKTENQLRGLYAPIVQTQMEKVGAVQTYNDLMARYNAIPLVPKPQFDLDDYVTQQALDGLFTAVGREEQRIREDPVARSTELLRKVFGNRN